MSTITAVATQARGADFDSTYQTDAEMYAVEAIEQVYREANFQRGYLFTLGVFLAGSSTTTSLDTIEGGHISAVFDAQGNDLIELDPDDFYHLWMGNTATRGKPAYWSITAVGYNGPDTGGLTVWPAPAVNTNLWVLGQQQPAQTDLEGADAVPLPHAWEKLVRYYVRAELFAHSDSDVEMATFWTNKFDLACKSMRSDQQRRRSNRQVPGTWSSKGAGVSGSYPSFHFGGLF